MSTKGFALVVSACSLMWQATLDVGADGDASSSTHLHVPDLSSAEELHSADVLSWLGWDTGFGPPGQALYCVDCRGFGESWPEGPVAAATSGADGVASSGFTADGRHPRWASYGLDYMYGHDCSHYHISPISRDYPCTHALGQSFMMRLMLEQVPWA